MAALPELAQAGVDTDALLRQYREQSSPVGGLMAAAANSDQALANDNRRAVRGSMGLLSRPIEGEGGVGFEPRNFLSQILGEGARAFDAPRAAALGQIPAADMTGEALGTAGLANLGGAAMTAPEGALRANAVKMAANRDATAGTTAQEVAGLLRNGRAAQQEQPQNAMMALSQTPIDEYLRMFSTGPNALARNY